MAALRRLAGLLLAVVAIASLAVDAVAVYGVWTYRAAIERDVAAALATADRALATTESALAVADHQLAVTATSLLAAERTAGDTAAALGAVHTATSVAETILRSDVPATIYSVRDGLAMAQPGLLLVDAALLGLADLPFLGVTYRPEVPLNRVVGDVAERMDRLPPLTVRLAEDLDRAGDALPPTARGATEMAEALRITREGIPEARAVAEAYRRDVAELRTQLAALRGAIEPALIGLAAGLTFVLVWLAALQASLLARGLSWLLGRRRGAADTGAPP